MTVLDSWCSGPAVARNRTVIKRNACEKSPAYLNRTLLATLFFPLVLPGGVSNDNENGLAFFTMPSGVDKLTHMGMIINRRISYLNEINTFPAIDTRYGEDARLKPSLASPVFFEDVQPHNPVYISPYVLGGFTRDYSMNEGGTNYLKSDNPKYTGGLDVKYNLNSNLTLDFTVNTDFAQVEADDQQVNLTRYSLFFPEKRLFFQERSSVFSYNLGGPQELFYSRRIGISQGEPVRILGGARLVGRVGDWDMGFLNMNTEKFNGNPAENFGVARVRKQVFNPNSYVGAILSTRVGFDGNYNASYGVDGIFRLFGDDYVDLKLAQTKEKGVETNMVSADPTYFAVNWERRSDKGLGYNVKYAYFGRDFNPGTGFLFNSRIQELGGELQYGFFPGEDARIFWHRLSLDFAAMLGYEIGEFFDGNHYAAEFKADLNLSSSLQLSGSYKLDRISFPERDQQFTNNLARVKMTFMLNTKISASSYIQFNENDNLVVTNFRLRYNPADGNDFYLVFNDLRNYSDNLNGVKSPAYLNRTLLLKYTHTFRL